MEIGLEDARLMARALVYVSTKLSGELERILTSDESDYIKEAAVKQYNEDSAGFTKLHIALGQAFPELTQR